jgi:hypothetical protein
VENSRAVSRKLPSTRGVIGSDWTACLTASIRISPLAIGIVILKIGLKLVIPSLFICLACVNHFFIADKLVLLCRYYTDNVPLNLTLTKALVVCLMNCQRDKEFVLIAKAEHLILEEGQLDSKAFAASG